jgi:hypothetical protein
MFSDHQLAAIDVTEPNYRRVTVECELFGRDRAELYVSRWGVIAPPGRSVWPLMAQADLFDRLIEGCPGFRDAADEGTPASVADLLMDQGWARDSGLR